MEGRQRCTRDRRECRQSSLTWAQRLRRVFAIDIETCKRCGGKLRVIASIEDPEVIERILDHLSRDAVARAVRHPRSIG